MARLHPARERLPAAELGALGQPPLGERVRAVLAVGPEIDTAVSDLLGDEGWTLCDTYKSGGKPWAKTYSRKRDNGRLDVKVQGTIKRPLRQVRAGRALRPGSACRADAAPPPAPTP